MWVWRTSFWRESEIEGGDLSNKEDADHNAPDGEQAKHDNNVDAGDDQSLSLSNDGKGEEFETVDKVDTDTEAEAATEIGVNVAPWVICLCFLCYLFHGFFISKG